MLASGNCTGCRRRRSSKSLAADVHTLCRWGVFRVGCTLGATFKSPHTRDCEEDECNHDDSKKEDRGESVEVTFAVGWSAHGAPMMCVAGCFWASRVPYHATHMPTTKLVWVVEVVWISTPCRNMCTLLWTVARLRFETRLDVTVLRREQYASQSNEGGTFLDSNLEVVAHPH